MTIYVDSYIDNWVPKKWHGGGHMLTTDIDELHAMARRIGLRRVWFQDTSFPHYDLTARRRGFALRAGATEIGFGELPDDLLMRCKDGSFETRAERLARRAATSSARPRQ